SDGGRPDHGADAAIAYDGAKLAEGPKSWSDFWDVKKFPGKRALRKSAKYTLEFELLLSVGRSAAYSCVTFAAKRRTSRLS
ncbi:hypothetical protein ACC697_39410, partial [Rhizobium ruizarguesonis]